MKDLKNKIKYLSTKQVSDYLGLHPRTIQRLAKKGKIKSIRLGKLLKFRASDIKKYSELGTDFSKQPTRKTIQFTERRVFPRINSNFKCQYSVNLPPFKHINSEGIIKNLSAGGVFLINQNYETNEISTDDTINLGFLLNRTNIEIEGRVVRKNNIGLGIKLRNLEKETKNKIIKYIG